MMELINHTPFPSQAFAGIDQHGQSFHVIVLRQTLSFSDGALVYASQQAPLCESDEFFGAPNASSVRQESDLCHYKPRCDIIVNACAHAPLGRPVRRFPVRLVVKHSDTPAPLPDAGAEVPPGQANRGASTHTPATPGTHLVDKQLEVTGERHFQQKSWPQRLLLQVLRWTSLSLVRATSWRLTAPGLFTSLPLRAEFAYGGQSRIDTGDAAAGRLRKPDLLSPELLAAHPDSASPTRRPVAHAVDERNPVGLGFARQWELRARRRRSVAAPRIEHHGRPVTAKSWWQGLSATLEPEPAALGVRPKSHPLRRALMGTVDAAFIQSGRALPEDFDFAIWNAAPPDQQTGFLTGDEVIELTNLSPHDGAGALRDPSGKPLVREGDPCTMNSGNNPGIYVTTEQPSATPPASAVATSDPPVMPETAKEEGMLAQARTWARQYKEHYSAPLHDIASDAIDKGGAVAAAGAQAAAAGGGMVATGIGAAPGAAIVVTGGALAAAGELTATGGVIVDAAASVGDAAADYALTGKKPDVGPLLIAFTERVLISKLDKLIKLIPGRKAKARTGQEQPVEVQPAGDGVTIIGKGIPTKDDCGIKPYKDQKCPKGQERHHIVPDYALRYGSRQDTASRIPGMPSFNDGPSICLTGRSSEVKDSEHRQAHDNTDPKIQAAGERSDNGPRGVAPIGEIIEISVEEAGKVKPHCKEEIKQKVDDAFKGVDSNKYGRTTQQLPKGDAKAALENGEKERRRQARNYK